MDVNLVSDSGHRAISLIDHKLIKLMLKTRPDLEVNHITIHNGNQSRIVPSLLTRAVKLNKTDLVESLLNRYVNVLMGI